MNTYVGYIITKSSIDIFFNTLNYINRPKINQTPKLNINDYFEDNDIHFKLSTISTYIDLHKDNICYNEMIKLISKINNNLEIIKTKQEQNNKMKLKMFNHNLENDVMILNKLIIKLENRFKLYLVFQ